MYVNILDVFTRWNSALNHYRVFLMISRRFQSFIYSTGLHSTIKKKSLLAFCLWTVNKTLADTSTSCYCPHNILSITVTSLKRIFSRNKGNKLTNPKIKKNYSNSTCCGPLSLLSATPKGPRLPLWKPLLSTLTTNHRMNQCLLV